MRDFYRQAGIREPLPHYPAPGDTYRFDNLCYATVLSVREDGMCAVEFDAPFEPVHNIHVDKFPHWTLEWVPPT